MQDKNQKSRFSFFFIPLNQFIRYVHNTTYGRQYGSTTRPFNYNIFD